MAWLDKRGQNYRLVFQVGGQTFKRSLGTSDRREAEGLVALVERRIKMVERGELTVPEDAELATFLVSDGKAKKLPAVAVKSVMTLAVAVEQYLASIPTGSLEENTLYTLRIHLRHIRRLLGDNFRVEKLGFHDLQRYVEVRSREGGRRGKKVNPVTIRKELTSFSGLWSWMRRGGHGTGEFPNKGLHFPKTAEKPKFQTWAEIERQIAWNKLTETEQAELWDGLYLTTVEIDEVLDFVGQKSDRRFMFPMLLIAAHTGARRSEILRSQVNDFDFAANTILIHEKKRAKGKSTTRAIPMSPRLRTIMEAWVGDSTCRHAFHADGVPLTVDDASRSFTATFAGTKWKKLKGWHVFRHSFISNCASRGIDQRMIDAWSGHQTEEMRKRDTHLLPNAQQSALQLVFGA